MRFLRFKQPDDDGMAPCWHEGRLSLATCKPRVRRNAKVGDWVIGFLPKRHGRGHVIWAARVAEIVPIEDYQRRFPDRPDAIYQFDADGRVTRLAPDYHASETDMARDLSGPVLLFDPAQSWYFGSRPKTLSDGLMHLAPYSRDYNVAHVRDGDDERLTGFLGQWSAGINGTPRHRQRGKACGGC